MGCTFLACSILPLPTRKSSVTANYYSTFSPSGNKTAAPSSGCRELRPAARVFPGVRRAVAATHTKKTSTSPFPTFPQWGCGEGVRGADTRPTTQQVFFEHIIQHFFTIISRLKQDYLFLKNVQPSSCKQGKLECFPT